MKDIIERMINEYVTVYPERKDAETRWGKPLIKFADAGDEMFSKLKEIISPGHALPQDFLEDARTVIVYFLPFAEEVVLSNSPGKYSSTAWARAYLETNQLINNLNNYLKREFELKDYKAAVVPATHNFDEENLLSDWSHRHAAYIAGLGKFGLNNMLITEKGCCGRIGSLITDIEIEPSAGVDEEYCLYKSSGSCKKCIKRCVNQALGPDSFDRHRCYEMLLENDRFHARLHADLGLTDVCGKCCVDLPCSLTIPVR